MLGSYITRELTSHKFTTDDVHKRAIKSMRKALHLAISRCNDIDAMDEALDVLKTTHDNNSGRTIEK